MRSSKDGWACAFWLGAFLLCLGEWEVAIVVVVVCGPLLGWYFSPENVFKRTQLREFKKREEIKAQVWSQASTEAYRWQSAAEEHRKESVRDREGRIHEEEARLNQIISELKRKRSNIANEMANLYQVAKSLQEKGAPPSEYNPLHEQIAQLKDQKLSLDLEIDETRLAIKRLRYT